MKTFLQEFFNDLINRVKPKPEAVISAVDTAPLRAEQLKSASQPQQPKMSPPQLIFGTAQSVGMQRDHNEDTLYAMQAIMADGGNDLPFGIFIIADGMGGHLNGEVASGCAARTLTEFLLNKFYLPFISGSASPENESIYELFESAVNEAHRSVLRNAPGGGTTLTAGLVVGDQVTLSHVGDSRAYFIYPDDRIEVMTQDHTLVKRLQDLGQIDEKEANIHPQRNVLYRALGQSEPFHPDIHTYTLPHSGYLMLCSDGLWGSVRDEDMMKIVRSDPYPASACQKLIEAANKAGGPDNISVILVQYQI